MTHRSLTPMVFTSVRGISQLLSLLATRAVKGQKVVAIASQSSWQSRLRNLQILGKLADLGKLVQAFVISHIRKPVL